MAKGFNLTAEINLRGPSNIRTVVADIRRQLGTVTAKVDIKIDPSAARTISGLNQALQKLNANLQSSKTYSDKAALSLGSLLNAGNKLNSTFNSFPKNVQNTSASINQLSNNTKAANQAIQQARTEFEEFGRQGALAVRRFAAFAVVTGVIFKVNNAVVTGTKQFIAFNQELVKVSQVTGTSVKNLDFLVSKITGLSTSLGVTSEDLISVSRTLAQAGLSARETEKALKALALSALAPSFDNLQNTVEGSIALMRQFSIGAEDLEKALGSINSVAAKFAVEAGDIVSAIQRTGGVFAAASKGVSEGTDALNEFVAIFTSVRATTRESAETIATGLRTIFTRIQRGSTIQALKEYGVVLTDLEGKFVGPYEAVRRLAEGLNLLDPRDLKFSRIVEELGGFRQIGKVIPLIQQFTTAQQALVVAQRGQGSLATDASVAQQALAVKISKVREEFVALIRSIGQSDSFQNFIKLSLDLTSGLIKLADSAKGVLPALTAIAAIRGASFVSQFATGFVGGLRKTPTTKREGGKVLAFNKGGIVPGSGRGDKVPALLEPGEVVINNRAAQKYGRGNLVRMNRYVGGGKIQDLLDIKPELNKYYDTEKNKDIYSNIKIQRPENQTSFRKTRQQYRQQAEDIWQEASRIYTNEGLGPANSHILKKTKINPGLYDKEELDPSNASPRRLNRIQGALAERTTRGQTRGLNKLPNQAGADFVYSDSNGTSFIEVKNKLTKTLDQDLISKALLAYSYIRGQSPTYFKNKKLDNISGLNIELRSTNPLDIQNFAEGSLGGIRVPSGKGRGRSGAKGARDIIEPISSETYSKWAKGIYEEYDADPSLVMAVGPGGIRMPPEIALANKLLTQYAFETGGAGMSLGKRFVRTPKANITDELRPYLVSDPSDSSELGFFEDNVRPFARAKSKAMSEKQIGKIGKDKDMANQTSRISDWEKGYASEWSKITRGGEVDNYLLSNLTGDIQKDYINARDNGPQALAKDFYRTRLRKAVRDALENMGSDVDYSGDFISNSLITRMAQGLWTGGQVQRFMSGSVGGVKAPLGTISQDILDRIKALGGPGGVKNLAAREVQEAISASGARTAGKLLDSRSLQADPNSARFTPYLEKVLQAAEGTKNDKAASVKKQLEDNMRAAAGGAYQFGLVSLYGPNEELGYSNVSNAKELVGSDGSTKYLTQIVRKSLPQRYAEALGDIQKDIAGLPARGAEAFQYTDIFGPSGPLAFDFDETLVKGADIFAPNGGIDIRAYNDLSKVEEALNRKSVELTLLGRELGKRLIDYPKLMDNIRVLTARPQSNAPLLAAKLSSFGLPIPPDKITGVSGGLNKVENLSEFETLIDDNLGNIQSVMAAGKKAYLYKEPRGMDPNNKSSRKAMSGVEGYVLEEIVRDLGVGISADDADPNRPIDYPKGLGSSASIWDIKPTLPTDTKRTNDSSALARMWAEAQRYFTQNFAFGGKADGPGFEEIRQQIIDKYPQIQFRISKRKGGFGYNLMGALKSKGGLFGDGSLNFQQPSNLKQLSDFSDKLADKLMNPEQLAFGGLLNTFNSGGTVPAMVSNGEAYIPPAVAKTIGYAKLDQMNQADRNGMRGFSKGGISVFKGSGSGTSDSIGPVGLPTGSYILREKATKALGLRSGGRAQAFKTGGSPQKSAAIVESFDPVSVDTLKALDNAIESLITKAVDKMAKYNPSILFDDAYEAAKKDVDPKVSTSLMRQAETGDQGAANMVADAQRKQVNSLVKVIRANDSSIPISQAKAAAERRVADAWGGLYKRTKEQEKQSSSLSRAMSRVTSLYSKIRGKDLTPEQKESRQQLSSFFRTAGTTLAFTAPMLAGQIGQAVGGSKGRGIEEATSSFSTFTGVGAQFGIIGTVIGSLAGLAAAVDGYTRGVLKAENELGRANIEKEAEKTEKTLGRLERDPRSQAITDNIISSLDKMSAEEAAIQKRNEKIREPTFLQKTGAGFQNTASSLTMGLVPKAVLGSPKLGTAEFDKYTQEIGQANAAQSKARADIALKTLSTKGSQGLTLDQALSSFGADAAKIQESIASGSVEYSTQLAKLTELSAKGAISAAELDQRKKGLIQKYYLQETEGLKAAMADKARATAAQKVAKALNLAVTSIDRTFGNMEAALGRGADAIAKASANLESIAMDRASIQSSFAGQNILENPRAYSSDERRSAVRQASASFGPDMAFVEKLSDVGNNIKDTITSIGASAQASGQSKEITGQEVQRTVDKQLQAAFGNNDLTRQLSQQVKLAIESQLLNTETEEIDIDKLLSEATGLTSIIEAEKKAFELLAQATKQASQAIDLYSSQVSKATEMLGELDNINAEGVSMRASNDFRLREMFSSQRVSVRERIGARTEESAARAGVKPDQFNLNNLTQRLDQLKQDRNTTQLRREQFQQGRDFTDPKTVAQINTFNASLISLNSQVDKTKNAIKNLPKDIQASIDDVATAMQDRLSKVDSQRQAGAGFAERLTTSTPDELRDINNTYNLLSNTLNGQIRTIQQSSAAQQAYQKVINDGGNAMEAMSAAQNAFATENKQAFAMFSDLIEVAGIDKQQANTMRADLLENMAKSQGMNMQNNPLFSRLVENLRKAPEDDPEIKRLKTLYQQLQEAQAQALEANRKIVLEDSASLIKAAGEEVKKAIETAKISFNEQQLNDIGLGLSRPGQVMGKSNGGIVYASTGKLINFQPKGTDTVPAMLTPGEFVVNARSTQENLPLLQAINKSKGGQVQYFNKGTQNPVVSKGPTPSIYDADYVDYVTEKFKGTPVYENARKLAAKQQLAYSRLNNSTNNVTQRNNANAAWKQFLQEAKQSGIIQQVPGPVSTTASAASVPMTTPKPTVAPKPTAVPKPKVPDFLPSSTFDFGIDWNNPTIRTPRDIQQEIIDQWKDAIKPGGTYSQLGGNIRDPIEKRTIMDQMRREYIRRLRKEGYGDYLDDMIKNGQNRPGFLNKFLSQGASSPINQRRAVPDWLDETGIQNNWLNSGSAPGAASSSRSARLPTSAPFRQRVGAYAGDLADGARGAAGRIGSAIGAGRRLLGTGMEAASNYAGNVASFANTPFAGFGPAQTSVGKGLRGLTRLGLGAGYVGTTAVRGAARGISAGIRTAGTSLLPTMGLNAISELYGMGSLSNESATLASFGIDAIRGGARALYTSPFATNAFGGAGGAFGGTIPTQSLVNQAGRLSRVNNWLPRVGNNMLNTNLANTGVGRAAQSIGQQASRIPGVSRLSNLATSGINAVRGSKPVAQGARAAATIGNLGGGSVGTAITGARGAAASAVAVNTALSGILEGGSFLYDRQGYSNRLANEEESEFVNANEQSGMRYAAGQAVSGFTNPFRMFAKFGRAAYSTSQAAANNQAAQKAYDSRNMQQRQDWSMGGRIQMIEGNEGYFANKNDLSSWVPARDPVFLDTLTGKRYDTSKKSEQLAFGNIVDSDRLAGFNLSGIERGWVQAKAKLEDKKAQGLITDEDYNKENSDLEARRGATTERYNRGYFTNTVTKEAIMQSSNLDTAVVAEQRGLQDARAKAQAQQQAEKRERWMKTWSSIATSAANATDSVSNTVGVGAQAVMNFASSVWNQTAGAARKNQEQLEEANFKNIYDQASSHLTAKPTIPGQIKEFERLGTERTQLEQTLAEFDPTGFNDEENKVRKNAIRSKILQINNQIIASKRKSYLLPMEEKQKQWKEYNTKVEKSRVLEEKQQIAASMKKEASLYANLEKVTKIKIPNDPEKLADWRAKAIQKIKEKFYLSGDPASDINMMTSYGLSPELANNLFRPMTKEQGAAVYDVLARQTKGGTYKYSDADLKLLQISRKELLDRVAKGNVRDASSLLERKDQLETEREKEFGRSLKQMGRFDALAQRAAKATSPTAQSRFRKNIYTKLVKSGYIDPRENASQNAARLSVLNLNPNTVSFIYPNQTGGMLAQPTNKQKGGVIYASAGRLINFQPKGTDTVPAMLTPGEFVVNSRATQQHLPLLQAINKAKGGKVSYYNAGGSIPMVTTGTQESTNIRNQQQALALQKQTADKISSINTNTNNTVKTTQSINNNKLPQISAQARNYQDVNTNGIINLNNLSNENLNRTSNVGNYLDKNNFPDRFTTVEDFELLSTALILRDIADLDNNLSTSTKDIIASVLDPNLVAGGIALAGAGAGLGLANAQLGAIGRFNQGGMVYASNGMLIPYQPRGTDTVPAMLTPGEFVVNKGATQANLPLLQAINGGAKGFATGGQVNYMSGGGLLGQMLMPMISSFGSLTSSVKSTVQALQNYQQQLARTQPNSVSNSGNGPNIDRLSEFTTKFDQFINSLSKINIPPLVQLQVSPIRVDITGAEALKQALEGPLGKFIQGEIQAAFGRLSAATEGAVPP